MFPWYIARDLETHSSWGVSKGDMVMLKGLITAGVLASGAVLGCAGVAHADDVLVVGYDGVEEYYLTEAECLADAPNVHLQINDQAFPYAYCRIGDDNGDTVHWYLWNTDTPR